MHIVFVSSRLFPKRPVVYKYNRNLLKHLGVLLKQGDHFLCVLPLTPVIVFFFARTETAKNSEAQQNTNYFSAHRNSPFVF